METVRSLCTALLLLALGSPLDAQTPADASASKGEAPAGTVERITVHGPSLAGNLSGDSPDRDVFVYLPPSYATSRNQRYPVVYLLHGYGLTGERWMTFSDVAAAADKNIAAGAMREMILVNPDTFTRYNGSMYSASPTIGDWETFIAEDLVASIDQQYRTVANRMSRGLGGHSMGGYGTLRIGMKRPDVFSSLYIMSACCLLNDPTTSGRGRGAAPAAPAAPSRAPTDSAAAPPPGRGRGPGFANAASAQAAAWASNPKNPPEFFDLPMKDGVPQPLIVAKFLANSPLAMIDQYLTNLRKYRAIAIEVGDQDGLAASNRQLADIFTNFTLPHTFEVYDGDHVNRVRERFDQKVLQFFSTNLSSASSGR